MNAAIAAPKATHLPVRLKVMHGLGSIAYGVKDNGFSTFLLLFYNQVIGLDPGVVGAAIMVALIADAFVDPIIGELTDRTRSRWGRRLPWLYGAPIPLAIMWMLLWHPPEMSNAMTVAWLIGFAIVVRSLVSMCEVPSVAIVPELTGDYDERTVVMRYRFLFGWGGGLLILLLAYGVFFGGAKGLVDPDGYFPYALSGALLMAGAVLTSAAGQHNRIAVSNLDDAKPATTLRQILGEMRDTLSNRAFLWLIFAALFGFINQGITFSMNNYLLGYFWQFTQGEMVAYVFLLFGSMIAAFLFVTPVSARLGKRDGAIFAGAISLLVNSGIYFAWIQGFFPGLPGKPSVAAMFALVFVSNSFSIILMILSSSMMADVVEASQSETGRRSEGLFFAGYFFMQKCAIGIGIFAAGLILSFAAFPANAKPGEVGSDVLGNLALGYALAVLVIGTLGLIVMRKFPISRADHEARLALLGDVARGEPDATGAHP
ncbi:MULTISPECIES: MFS transporter [unclassified Sphingopyxis]|uniref:MFS transporter n=1 Tax=unclassified Sphingopyxis TaxID=2614943 RepID=UPI00285623B5|nr:MULTISPECIES: MFS transporter [unclassified Sphingopyxis]MDR7061389.1 GPH family glycoside/pentoside/hexuronide:cation symporter [Sphingopyxis sp. BE235]MDR7181880.1 GPH family glycoside/pentoside/hexuronide:cation symporter [Sphingopyxis sp. BE249]